MPYTFVCFFYKFTNFDWIFCLQNSLAAKRGLILSAKLFSKVSKLVQMLYMFKRKSSVVTADVDVVMVSI